MGVMAQASSSVSQSSSGHCRFCVEIHRSKPCILDCSSTSAGGVRLGNAHHLDTRSNNLISMPTEVPRPRQPVEANEQAAV